MSRSRAGGETLRATRPVCLVPDLVRDEALLPVDERDRLRSGSSGGREAALAEVDLVRRPLVEAGTGAGPLDGGRDVFRCGRFFT